MGDFARDWGESGHGDWELRCAKMLRGFGYLESCSSRNVEISLYIERLEYNPSLRYTIYRIHSLNGIKIQ